MNTNASGRSGVRWMAGALACVALVSACSTADQLPQSGASGGSAPAVDSSPVVTAEPEAPAELSWSDYIYPQQVGYTCREQVSMGFESSGASIRTESKGSTTVAQVEETADGTRLVIKQKVGSKSYVDGVLQDSPKAVATTLTYLLRPDGSLATPFNPFQTDEFPGVEITVDGAVLLPPVPDVLSGEPFEGTMTISISAPAGTDAGTTDGGPMRIVVKYSTSGKPKKSVKVGSTTFEDIVETTTDVSMSIDNLADPDMQESMAGLLDASAQTVVTDWALGVGPVRATTSGGLIDLSKMKMKRSLRCG